MKDFRAVSLVAGSVCCEATRSVKCKRLLLTQGVALPLAACTMRAQCRCRYQNYPDRRALRGFLYGISERRKAEERRPADRQGLMPS
jgi:hypothetical protein